MRLRDYLDKTREDGESKAARCKRFGKQLGVSIHTVYKWINGQRRIRDDMKLLIQKKTEGQVKVQDMVKP